MDLRALRVDCPSCPGAVSFDWRTSSWRFSGVRRNIKEAAAALAWFLKSGGWGGTGRKVVQCWSKEDGEKDWWRVRFWQVSVYGGERRDTRCSVQNNFPPPKLSSCRHVVRLPTLFTSPGSWKDLARARACVFAKGSLIKALHHASRDAAEDKHGWAWYHFSSYWMHTHKHTHSLRDTLENSFTHIHTHTHVIHAKFQPFMVLPIYWLRTVQEKLFLHEQSETRNCLQMQIWEFSSKQTCMLKCQCTLSPKARL